MSRFRIKHMATAITAVVLVPGVASAQDSGHAGMQMPMNMPMPVQPSKKATPETRKVRHAQHQGHTAQPSVPAAVSPIATPAPMEMSTGQSGANEPRTPIPPVTDADRAAAVPPASDHPVHDNPIESYTVFNRLEAWNATPGSATQWEASSWIGTDLNRLWLRSEGEHRDGKLEQADMEVLYGHSVSPWWDVLTGVRHDFKPGASQDFAALGVQGLAPYKFEVAATAYVGQSGQTAARVEADYEALFTNRLILQPLIEVNFYGQDDEPRGIGSGLSTVEAGLRLRYEMKRRFAPYVGVVHEQAFGRTADFRRAQGENDNDTRFVAGVRIWF